jgi:cyanate lyase
MHMISFSAEKIARKIRRAEDVAIAQFFGCQKRKEENAQRLAHSLMLAEQAHRVKLAAILSRSAISILRPLPKHVGLKNRSRA